MSYYNIRDNLGRFTRAKRTSLFPNIVAGRLYGYRGSVIRAGRKCSNGKRHVSFHKQLHGFVNENELELISQADVKSYLDKANVAQR